MSRELKRWQAIFLATAIVSVPILSCSQRSLVLVTVSAPEGVAYTDVSLIITANGVEQTTFNKASFTDGVYKAGIYLPSDMSGKVSFSADVVQNNCEIAKGGPVDSPDVSSGATVSMTIGLLAQDCVPVDGGAGSSGTGGATGSGGARGTGGVTTGTGGTTTGSGGGVGSGGVVGTGGAVGSGGVVGTGGRGGSGTGGAVGTGGSGKGGATGSGGIVGSGGVIGSGGMIGSGGKGGSASGGTMGAGGLIGSGGSSGCNCPTNYICQPGTTTCVCSQSDVTACAANLCGTVTNICMQTVSCGTCPSGYYCDTTLNACSKLIVTGCGGSVSTGTGLVAGTAAAPICPVN